MAKQRTNMAAKPVSITEPPNVSAWADTKHENQQNLAALCAYNRETPTLPVITVEGGEGNER